MRKIVAPLLAATLLLSACGGAEEPLPSLTVTSEGEGKAPKVEFDAPLKLKKPVVKQLEEGDGAEIDPGQTLSLRMSAFNAKDGSRTMETYTQDSGDDLALDDQMKSGNPQLYKVLKDARVGSQFAYAVPPVDGGQSGPSRAGQVLVFTIESAEKTPVPLEKAKGEPVEPVEKLPTVKVNSDGVPEITIDKSDPKPDELVAQTLIKGSGEVVKKSDTITAHYVGVQWSNGKKFDSSWDRGTPSDFPLTGVIEGWTKGLSGQTVGSRVLLVIPPELAYGKDPASGQPGGTLVFVVDILGIS
ncbi:MAG TPA: FKBP-type peptidyl-prolyl cis-trans isomerase [Arthrobacter sp.]|nr:FKBP-type peptidyl-prolyl cis-trans isomerase [Arthrobacter sp.]